MVGGIGVIKIMSLRCWCLRLATGRGNQGEDHGWSTLANSGRVLVLWARARATSHN